MLVLVDFHNKNPWCERFKVSKEFYDRVQVGSLVEYKTKRGFLGVEWFYSGLSLVECKMIKEKNRACIHIIVSSFSNPSLSSSPQRGFTVDVELNNMYQCLEVF
ncbi:MAG: hypothetical protein ACK4SM_00950 [Aquificaceae bacterium]